MQDRITPPELYWNRRKIIRGGMAIGSGLATAGLYRWLNPSVRPMAKTAEIRGITDSSYNEDERKAAGFLIDEERTPEQSILTYNNFYEFTTNKERVASVAMNFDTSDWTLQVDGLVDHPTAFSIEQLRSLAPLEERVYRMRCVEAWSMVIPWVGFSVARLLEVVQPKPEAKYVAFETLYDPQRMPGQKSDVLQWPYVEGLRLDEAMHPLAFLALGLYGKELPPQDGAPIRLVIPWKYGFKGIKSIVKISLTSMEPPTSWNRYSPSEYGFYANVNPEVDHPRWSQATEQRIGESGRRKTLLFNGYEDQVADLYTGMDLRENF
ncbi:protein-methionine-sulfoxide reductase catalytic subunit MsrP [Neorhodopirellula pilleata]|uniref:Protein-methionine-sulfoxide reductase catalytic subunit MsrP n=1 Tax=Neorhodopirellula pilleata TaxID=2714738 RepID=A0A5C5ZR23_9BACT|nr:protein-methionine-sulfoxide reductase catalytic subunit MsrP [Neorhodopirellula pilleata]TWT89498.1 Sulfoxide reductase catalytic subunit YedY precursor [Neorhodopirellula pilleata]